MRVFRIFVVTVSAVVFLAGSTSPAQSAQIDGFGVKAGVGFVQPDFQFAGAEVDDPGSVLRPTLSAFLEWKLNRKSRFNLLHEIRYFSRGYELFDSERFAHYVGFSALLRSNIQGRKGGGLYLFFGPSLDVLASHDGDEVLDRFNNLSISGHAGLGFEFPLGASSGWTLEIRFNSEFTNAYDDTPDIPLESVRHRTLELNAGLRF